MKKILLSTAAVAALSVNPVHAEGVASNMGGFYTGLAAGIANNYVDFKNGFAITGGQDSNQYKLGGASAVFNLYTGYGKFWGNFYAGLEGNFGFNTFNQKNITSVSVNRVINVKSPWHGGFSVRLGRSVFSQQALVYLGLGVQFEGHELKFTGLPAGGPSSFRKKFTTTHFAPSIGLEGMITERMTMRMQIDYNIPVKKTMKAPSMGRQSNNLYPQTLRISSVVAKVGIGYKF